MPLKYKPGRVAIFSIINQRGKREKTSFNFSSHIYHPFDI